MTTELNQPSMPRYRFTLYTGYPFKADLYICHKWIDGHGYCYLPGFYKKEHVDKIIASKPDEYAVATPAPCAPYTENGGA
jgi:hypothetical protein